MNKIALLFAMIWPALVLFVAPSSAGGAEVTQRWTQRFRLQTNAGVLVQAITADAQGNVFVAGDTNPFTPSPDICTIKYHSENGAQLWVKHTPMGIRSSSTIAADSAGNVIVMGYATHADPSQTTYHIYLAKYAAADGALIWDRDYSTSDVGGSETANTFAVDAEGNVVVAGSFSLVKLAAADGGIVWRTPYQATQNEAEMVMAVDPSGNVLVTSGNKYPENRPYTTVKYSAADGGVLWEAQSLASSFASPRAIKVDGNGNAIVTGNGSFAQPWGQLQSSSDFYTVKFAAADGAILWEAHYNRGLDSTDMASDLTLDADGNVFVTGTAGWNSGKNFHTIKYEAADGTTLWERDSLPPGEASDRSTLAVNANGNVVVTELVSQGGPSSIFDDLLRRAHTVEYKGDDGTVLWQNLGDAQIFYSGAKQAVTPDGGVAISGSIAQTSYVFWDWSTAQFSTVKYAPVDMAKTLPPVLSSPVTGTAYGTTTLNVTFSLPEPAQPGSVLLTFIRESGGENTTLRLANPQESVGIHSLSIVKTDLGASDGVASVEGPDLLEDGAYSVVLSYQAVTGKPASSAAASDVMLDTITLPPSLLSPASGTTYTNVVPVQFTLPERAKEYTLTLTFAGPDSTVSMRPNRFEFQLNAGDLYGNPRNNSFFNPVYPLVLNAGSIDIGGGSDNYTPVSLVAGTYTVTLSYRDMAGNLAATSTTTDVTIASSTPPPILTAPATNAVVSAPIDVAFTLPVPAVPGSLKLRFGSHDLILHDWFCSAGPHSFSLLPSNPTAAFAIESGGPIPEGVYEVKLIYQAGRTDGFHPMVVAVSKNVTLALPPAPPTLFTPAGDTVVHSPMEIRFTLPSLAAPGGVKLSFGANTLVLAASQETAGEHSFIFDPRDPMRSPEVANASANPIPNGNYTVTLSFRETVNGPTSSASAENVTVSLPPFLPILCEPTSGSLARAATTISFKLPCAAAPGSVELRFNTYKLVLGLSQEIEGMHSFVFDPRNPTMSPEIASGDPIPDGQYTVSLSYRAVTNSLAASASAEHVTVVTALDRASIVASGTAVPGADIDPRIASNAQWSAWGPPAIDDSGSVVFRGKWTASGGPSRAGIFTSQFGEQETCVLIASTYEFAAGVNGQARLGIKYRGFANPVATGGGIAFLATLAGPGLTRANNVTLIHSDGHVQRMVVQLGQAMTGVPGSQLAAIESVAVNGNSVLFTARLRVGPGGVTANSDFGAWRWSVGQIAVPVVLEGSLLSDVSSIPVKSYRLLQTASGTPGTDRGLRSSSAASFQASFGNAASALVDADWQSVRAHYASGTATVPGAPGARWATFGPPATSQEVSGLAFRATLRAGPGGVTSANSVRLFFEGTGITSVARGAAAPGLPSGAKFTALRDPVVSPGATAFAFMGTAKLGMALIPGIWWQRDGGALEDAIAVVGETPPGLAPEVTWAQFTSLAASDFGPIFTARLAGTPPRSNKGLWATDSNGALHQLLRTGDPLDGKTITNFTALAVAPGSQGVRRSFTADGRVIAHVLYTDGSAGLVKITLP